MPRYSKAEMRQDVERMRQLRYTSVTGTTIAEDRRILGDYILGDYAATLKLRTLLQAWMRNLGYPLSAEEARAFKAPRIRAILNELGDLLWGGT